MTAGGEIDSCANEICTDMRYSHLIQTATALCAASNHVYASLCPVGHYCFGHQPTTALRHKQQWVECVWIVSFYLVRPTFGVYTILLTL